MHARIAYLSVFHLAFGKASAQAAFSWFQCRANASDACRFSEYQDPCNLAVSQSCLTELGKSLEFTVRVAATSIANASAYFIAQSKLNQAFWALHRVKVSSKYQDQGQYVTSPSWPGVFRFLLSSPGLLEALDQFQTYVKQQAIKLGAIRETHCEEAGWQKFWRVTKQWRNHMNWPPDPVWEKDFVSHGHRELNEWGTKNKYLPAVLEVAARLGFEHEQLHSKQSCVSGVLVAHAVSLLPQMLKLAEPTQYSIMRNIESLLLSITSDQLIHSSWPIWAVLRYLAAWVPPRVSHQYTPVLRILSGAFSETSSMNQSLTENRISSCATSILTHASHSDAKLLHRVPFQWARVLKNTSCHTDLWILLDDSLLLEQCLALTWEVRVPLHCVEIHGRVVVAKYATMLDILGKGPGDVVWIHLHTLMVNDPIPSLREAAHQGKAALHLCNRWQSYSLSSDLIVVITGAERLLAEVVGALYANPLLQEDNVLTMFSRLESQAINSIGMLQGCGCQFATVDGWRRMSAPAMPLLIGGLSTSVILASEPGSIDLFVAQAGLSTKSELATDGPYALVAISYAHRCCQQSQPFNRDSAKAAGASESHALNYRQLLEGTAFAHRNAAILNAEKGAGWWLWKPYAIQWALRKVGVGDIVVYLDAGLHFRDNISLPALARKVLSLGDVAAARMECCLERHWTSRCVLNSLGVGRSASIVDTEQLASGFIFLRKGAVAERFVDRWLRLAEHAVLLTGSCSLTSEDFPGFCEHRADQSIFSVLFKQFGFEAFSEAEATHAVSYDRNMQ